MRKAKLVRVNGIRFQAGTVVVEVNAELKGGKWGLMGSRLLWPGIRHSLLPWRLKCDRRLELAFEDLYAEPTWTGKQIKEHRRRGGNLEYLVEWE